MTVPQRAGGGLIFARTEQNLVAMKVDGCVAWVSGAAQGIGLELSKALAAQGAKVVMVDVCDESTGKSRAEEVARGAKGEASFFRADLTQVEQVKKALEEPTKRFGSPASIVCGNAGIVVNDDSPKAQAMFELNTIGVILGTQIAIDMMRQAGIKGVVVNTVRVGSVV